MELKPLGIYIHIPFCIKKCDYCDFLSMHADDETKNIYLDNLEKEIEQKLNSKIFNKYKVSTIFVGGGTPSALSENQLEKLCKLIEKIKLSNTDHYNIIEITMECNPGTLNEQKVDIIKKYGINRISIGLQSANNDELKLLGRIHNYEDFLEGYNLLVNAGIENINIDLMSALPKQNIESWENTVRRAASLSPAHISAYSLIIEEGTPFFDRYADDEKLRKSGDMPNILPDEETERAMYEMTEKILGEYGYNRYEISNYSKDGYECLHNIGYWQCRPYLGFGLGAVSMEDEILHELTANDHAAYRYSNTDDLIKYNSGDFGRYNEELLSTEIQMEEFMFMNLRMMDGVSGREFERRFSRTINQVYDKQIKELLEEKLIKYNSNGNLCLTSRGIDISNYVFEKFIMT